MQKNIYEYRDYKVYFVDLLESHPSGNRGKRKELAEAIGCQMSHITKVLSGDGHFSQEQAEAAARHFGHTAVETEFLLQIVEFNRAGTPSLKKFYENVLQEKQKKYTNLKTLLSMPDSLQAREEAIYYSSWCYGAVHVLISVPEFRTRDALASKLQLPLLKVDEILEFLTKVGLCEKIGSIYHPHRPLLHLDKSSPLISKHHTNWRLQALNSIDKNSNEALHYSSVFTLSASDLVRIKQLIEKCLSESLKVITQSPEKEAAVLCIDLFKI